MRYGFLLAISVALATALPSARTGEPAKKPNAKEFMPVPQPVVPVPPPILVPESFFVPQLPRPNTREVWQYYGVDNFGKFRPRVILAPYGSYYYQTGQPYPWVNTRPTRFMPYVVD